MGLANLEDYSLDNLRAIDKFLEDNHDYVKLKEVKPDFVVQGGSYLLQMVKSKYGGNYYWNQEAKQPMLEIGAPQFKLGIFAYARIEKKIDNKEEEGLTGFMKKIEATFENAAEGDSIILR